MTIEKDHKDVTPEDLIREYGGSTIPVQVVSIAKGLGINVYSDSSLKRNNRHCQTIIDL